MFSRKSTPDQPYDYEKDPGSGYAEPRTYTDEEAQEILRRPAGGNPPAERLAAKVAAKPKKKKRVFMWTFIVVQLLFLVWIITGIAGQGPADTGNGVLTQEEAESAQAVGTGIGIMLIVGLWVAVDFILGVGYAIKTIATRNNH